jgi:hypothetical protein
MNRRSFLWDAMAGAGALTAWHFAGGRMMRSPQPVSGRGVTNEPWVSANEAKTRATYHRIKKYLDSIPAIDMHEHLRKFEELSGFVETDKGPGMNLYGLLKNSYITRINSVTPWKPGGKFEEWWGQAKHDFDNVRATDFYRYMWLAFRDLYNVDFDHITDSQASDLDRRIIENYRNHDWLLHVIKEPANIQLMVCDRFWKRFDFRADYTFSFLTLNVTTLVWGFHPSEYFEGNHGNQIKGDFDNPYSYARKKNLPLNSLDDYLSLLDRMFADAKGGDAVCLKTTLAYVRSLNFENVPKEMAVRVFGRSRAEITSEEATAFEDFVMWRLCELSAKYEMPFQIHTGDARVQGSDPMLLANLIEANPQTQFELFHGGYPWVRETGAIGSKFGKHVWIDCVWLPTISYTTAKSAFAEWLEVMPSNRILWGGDDLTAEGIYGETELVRRCWAEVLAEKVDRGELAEDDARRIGKQILRDNALELYPRLKERVNKVQNQTPKQSG